MSRRRSYSGRGGILEGLAYWAYFVVVLLVVVLAFGVAIVRPFNKVSDIRTVEGTVTEKTVKRADKSDVYMVFIRETSSGEVIPLEVTDSLLRKRFNSSDVYGDIEVGKTYIFEVGGSRVPLLSWYPNIYGCEEVINAAE